MHDRGSPAAPVPGGFGFPLGFIAGIVATLLAVATGAAGHPAWSLGLLALTVAAVAAVTSPAGALGTAVACWCLHDGFVLGRHGTLVLVPASAVAAAVLVPAALVVDTIATAVRVVRRRLVRIAPVPARVPAQCRAATPVSRYVK